MATKNEGYTANAGSMCAARPVEGRDGEYSTGKMFVAKL